MTPQQVKNQFKENGQTIADWARANNFPANKVSEVLNGRSPALRGKPHEIAVALGIKKPTQETLAK